MKSLQFRAIFLALIIFSQVYTEEAVKTETFAFSTEVTRYYLFL